MLSAAAGAGCGGGGDGSKFVVDSKDGSVDAAIQPFCISCSADSAGGVGDGNSVFADFPSAPVIDAPDAGPSAPPNSAQLFGAPSQGAQSGGPCLIEPEIGSLYPKNWLRPRFRWAAGGGSNLFELRLSVANQTNELVVYTAATEWTMPLAMWNALRTDSNDVPMKVTVRGGVLGGATL